MKHVYPKRREETFVFSKKSGANLVLTATKDGGLKVSFGDLTVEVAPVVISMKDNECCLSVKTNGDLSE